MKKITGNSYHIRDLIKSKGGKWNPQEKAWYVPEVAFEEVKVAMGKKILTGQLWEECRKCGFEPVYISLNCLCEDCG